MAGASIEYVPSLFEATPVVVPSRSMVTPGIGCPVLSVTFPETLIAWAITVPENRISKMAENIACFPHLATSR